MVNIWLPNTKIPSSELPVQSKDSSKTSDSRLLLVEYADIEEAHCAPAQRVWSPQEEWNCAIRLHDMNAKVDIPGPQPSAEP